MADIPTRKTFEDAYAGEAPWDIGKPQKDFVTVAGQIGPAVLDAGCGTGENALFFAERGCKVTGIDFLAEPIERAKAKAAKRGVAVDFRVADATALGEWTERFDNVIDCGLFHVFSDEDRKRYVAGLAHVLKPGGRLFFMCFSDAEPGEIGPRRVSKGEIEAAFSDGWRVESAMPTAFALNPNFKDAHVFSAGGPKAWFVVARRG
jgi:cyclopropane fatty-acyl-phospholipid synthase-like methyltransferase